MLLLLLLLLVHLLLLVLQHPVRCDAARPNLCTVQCCQRCCCGLICGVLDESKALAEGTAVAAGSDNTK
jgi:hypothetical protein